MITNKFTYQPLNRETIDGKRHYVTPDNQRVSSVTTILDATKTQESRDALNNWRKRVGTEKAQNITTEAAGRGTRMHKWLENYVKNGMLDEPGTNPYSQQSHVMANKIIEHGLINVNEYWGVEIPVYYPSLYAGTTDCVGVWKDKPAIIDFKQSNKAKKREWIDDYFMQLCAYMLAHDEVHSTKIEAGVILMCTQDFQYQEFVLEGSDLEKYKNMWWDRVAEYYKNKQ